ncbi:hypothetical protein DERP_005331 [Dermatophagoides pteronyssinus]|uniref:Uncharacterized protein LOC113790492 n=2 Tax=Dermatophagoides pteronyssinus TaxID=6956 RepID=A0A6P6XR67_DERPT|nr:uncharacterized protein LOC113790492 [Dermatophagoides pteronyssinus]KAH9423750.1 hypothetical protein DERP_005331 [Dermatophagoides pteronyssinus]
MDWIPDTTETNYDNKNSESNTTDEESLDSNILIFIIIVCVIIIVILTVFIWILCCRFYRTMTLAGMLEQRQKKKMEKIKRKLVKELSTKFRDPDQSSSNTITRTTIGRSQKDEHEFMNHLDSEISLPLLQTPTNLHDKTNENLRKLRTKPTARLHSKHPSLLLTPSKRFESLKSIKT